MKWIVVMVPGFVAVGTFENEAEAFLWATHEQARTLADFALIALEEPAPISAVLPEVRVRHLRPVA